MGREIESHQGLGRLLAFLYIKKLTHKQCTLRQLCTYGSTAIDRPKIDRPTIDRQTIDRLS
jgi:hypothetical protein